MAHGKRRKQCVATCRKNSRTTPLSCTCPCSTSRRSGALSTGGLEPCPTKVESRPCPRRPGRYRTDGETSGLNGRSLAWPRGKVLGGSSALNGLLYIRGLKHDYDAWAAAGNQGWSYEELLPHFRRCEDAPFDHPDRGTGGPMSVCEGSYRTDLAERYPSCRIRWL